MKYRLFDKSYLYIALDVVMTFEGYIQRPGMDEAGGILVGRCFHDRIEIDLASTPSKKDKAGPTFFIRAKKPAQKIIDDCWKKSNGEQIYLGEWHTHSQKNPIPSNVDIVMINNMLKTSKMEISFLFLLIIGSTGNIWAGIENGTGLCQISPV